ncbi:RNA recognition motif domain-containing protein [Halodesulfovibrio spirochaetisodalis]|uniref:RNA-binding protein n=1 Tax=Halodesulfovibrio spirochaetisodalis TaxID=1560234 RepID=A0A1B7XDL8_9BACT|nr:RNA-binding protein [Halodesulfovibrio spirochaetisodalis]OBQ52152.1 RNA-binding protein [Halodesulfovibrio spirochaetisodalis]
MIKSIFVGNLAWSAEDDDLRSFFEECGTVIRVRIMKDQETGRSRGFAFVDMDADEADAAIETLNGKNLMGRPASLSEAKPRAPRR